SGAAFFISAERTRISIPWRHDHPGWTAAKAGDLNIGFGPQTGRKLARLTKPLHFEACEEGPSIRLPPAAQYSGRRQCVACPVRLRPVCRLLVKFPATRQIR
ncbi:MAG: hypothetical protein ACRECY_17420, partial [Phyllobacterium sp.]